MEHTKFRDSWRRGCLQYYKPLLIRGTWYNFVHVAHWRNVFIENDIRLRLSRIVHGEKAGIR